MVEMVETFLVEMNLSKAIRMMQRESYERMGSPYTGPKDQVTLTLNFNLTVS